MTSSRPREVFDQLITRIAEGRRVEIADLYAKDAVVEAPFRMPEPIRFEGREQLRAHFTRDLPVEFLKAAVTAAHETTDPEVIVVEYDYDLRIKANGREVTIANIQVLRVRDGLIVSSRDFHNHWALAEAAR